MLTAVNWTMFRVSGSVQTRGPGGIEGPGQGQVNGEAAASKGQ